MYYKNQKIQNKNQKNKITEKEISNNDNQEEINNYDEDNIDEVIKAFEYFDTNHSGKIYMSDLTKALLTFGDIMTEEEMFKIFREAGININTDEEIDYIKFINFWIGNTDE